MLVPMKVLKNERRVMAPRAIKTIFEVSMAVFGLVAYLLVVIGGLEVFGWFGMGMVGAAALGISLRVDLFQRCGNVHSQDVSRALYLQARLQSTQTKLAAWERLRIEAVEARSRRWQKAANRLFTAVTIVGFGLFIWDIRAEFLT